MSATKRIAVGLSGGVDSSVAAALLKAQGHEVTGITMRVYDPSFAIEDGPKHGCFGSSEAEDIAVCERVSASLGIRYEVIDLRAEYRAMVIDYFRAEYLAGRTPNPCVRCNATLKFGFLVERARSIGLDFDFFATGHYARLGERRGRPCLMKAVEASKDQSYFLYRLGPEVLSRTLFPLGAMAKADVRAAARELGLETADLAESQDFVGGDYGALFKPGEARAGDIVDESGEVLGRHRGIVHYTIGQRRGVGVSAGAAVYVKSIDAARNRITVAPEESLYARALAASGAVLQDPEEAEARVEARIRQNHRPAAATMRSTGAGRLEFHFDAAQRGIAPGQSVVAYEGDAVVAGGIIESALEGDNP
jgi:tRNA-specific 2-thiouridylase